MGQNINLQTRDILLLNRLCQFGYLKLDSISEFIFKTSYKNVSRRLIKLRKLDLIHFIRRCDYEGTRIYIPVMKNIRHLVENETWEQGQQLCALKPWFFRLVQHCDQVQHWALRVLDMCPTAEIKLEYLLDPDDYSRSGNDVEARRKIPDFIVQFDDRKQIAFEVELHPKSKDTYKTIFTNMFEARKCPVLYLASTQSIKTKLQEMTERWKNYHQGINKYPLKIFIKTFDEVQTDEQLKAVLHEAISVLDAERAAELERRLFAEREQKAKEEKQKEEERLRAERLAQLTTTSAQTPPPLHQGKGFARDQQDGQGDWEDERWKDTRSVWEKLGDFINDKF